MERIKQAIEKAKQQGADETSQRPLAAVAPAFGEAPAAGQTAEIGPVSYDSTRIIQLDEAHLERHRIVAHNKSADTSWAFDLLRTQVLQKMEENGWRTLAITSPTPEAGKTVVAINLAMSIAQYTTKTALVVDFDLRRPKIGAYLGLPMEKSLNDLLADTAELRDVLVNPSLPRLVVLPTRRPVAHSTEMLSSPRVSELITDLRERYASRIIIFDLPPLLSTDDAIALLPKIDCVLLVVANGMSSQQEIEDSLRHIPEANLLGVVLNKAETEPRAYYY